MITYMGELVDVIRAAATQGHSPRTEIRVRIGPDGAEYKINELVAVQDQRGLSLVLEGCIVPERG